MLALAILLIGAASIRWPGFGPASLEPAWLVPPIAAWLVARFGRSAWSVALVCLALLVLLQLSEDRRALIGGRADVALLAAGAAWLVHRGVNLAALAARPAPPAAWTALPLLLPLYATFPPLRTDDFALGLPWFVLGLLLPALVLAGVRGVPWRGLALAGVAAAVAGVVLAVVSRNRFATGDWSLGYSFMQPMLLGAAALAWSGGEALRRAATGLAPRRLWLAPWLGVAATLALWFDPAQVGVNAVLAVDWGALRRVYPMGVERALPLAGFLAGALIGLRAAWIVAGIALVPGLLALGLLWSSDGEIRAWIGNVAAAPIALAWGWLGAFLAGRTAVVPTFRILAVALIAAALALVAVASWDGSVQAMTSLLGAGVAAVLATLAGRVARRLGVTGDGWIPVLLLPLYGLGLVLMGWDFVAELVREVGDLAGSLGSLTGSRLADRLLLLAPAVLAAALLIREILRGVAAVPKVMRDAATLARALRGASGSP